MMSARPTFAQEPLARRTELAGTALAPPDLSLSVPGRQNPASTAIRDWAMVPESYSIGLDQCMMMNTSTPCPTEGPGCARQRRLGERTQPPLLLYEAYEILGLRGPGLHNDTFEIVVDGDRSGGPLIPQFRNNADQDTWDAHFSMHGVQAQNYHS